VITKPGTLCLDLKRNSTVQFRWWFESFVLPSWFWLLWQKQKIWQIRILHQPKKLAGFQNTPSIYLQRSIQRRILSATILTPTLSFVQQKRVRDSCSHELPARVNVSFLFTLENYSTQFQLPDKCRRHIFNLQLLYPHFPQWSVKMSFLYLLKDNRRIPEDKSLLSTGTAIFLDDLHISQPN